MVTRDISTISANHVMTSTTSPPAAKKGTVTLGLCGKIQKRHTLAVSFKTRSKWRLYERANAGIAHLLQHVEVWYILLCDAMQACSASEPLLLQAQEAGRPT